MPEGGPQSTTDPILESLAESGLSHLTGKTFRSVTRPESYEDGQSVAAASAGGMDKNSTPTRYRIGSSGPETRLT
jgi:hypothetical protein